MTLPRTGAFAALAAAVVALLFAFGVARVHQPPSVFPKYLAAATAPAAEQAERQLDYSPLYLTAVRSLAAAFPQGSGRAILVLQAFLLAGTAAAVALAACRLSPQSRWVPWVAGLGTASYRPFLVYCGVHEPEILILFCLAVAVLAGLLARSRPSLLWAAVAFAALAGAGLSRPQHLLLFPVWIAWIAAATPRGSRWKVGLTALLAGGILVGPVLLSRSRAAGFPVLMDPGAVFYEGNAPGATGLIRFAPSAVLALERARRGQDFDYGHVAYRRIAAWALGQPAASSAAANSYWTGLGRESLKSAPGDAARRFLRKAAMAVMPYEGHDLASSEQLDRRLRSLLPWSGFALLAAALPWLLLAPPPRWKELAGPLAIVILAFGLQAALYASARQRLPAAFALGLIAPVLLDDLLRGRLRAIRPALLLALGGFTAAGLGAATARIAVMDQLQWNQLLGAVPEGWGERLAAFQDGRLYRPVYRAAAERFNAGEALVLAGRPQEALEALAPLVGTGQDFTVDEQTVGVAEYQAGRALLALGDRANARLAFREALAVRPHDPRLLAYVRWAEKGGAAAEGWRPPGCDPVSARLALARAAEADGDREAARRFLSPLRGSFPELAAPYFGSGAP